MIHTQEYHCTFPTFKDISDWPVQRHYQLHLELMDSKDKKRCIKTPFMWIDSTCCPPDILHMKKGIISKLINQVVDWVLLQGKEDKLVAQMKDLKIPFM